MGFRPEPTHYKLDFADGPYQGLEVVVRSMTLRESMAFDRLRFREVTNAEDNEAKTAQLAAALADVIVSWNLEGADGQLLPVSADSLLDQYEELSNIVMREWRKAVTEVPAPLDRPSPNGSHPMEASLPMADS